MSVSPRTRAARITARVLVPLLATLGLAVIPGVAQADPVCPGSAVISNGTVLLGVNCFGELGTVPANAADDGQGLEFIPTGNEAVSHGKPYEGWGVQDTVSGVKGYADQSAGTSSNLTQYSFDSTGRWAHSVVDVGSTFRVDQLFQPAAQTPNLYEATVSVTNISGAMTHLRYRRVMDWDIAPTAFDEYVTLQQGTSTSVKYTSDDGFAPADPTVQTDPIAASGSFVDSGPTDHGALFDFDFGNVPAGGTRTFKIFYGATRTKSQAIDALTKVSAEAYSLGQPSKMVANPNPGGEDVPAVDDSVNTFIFGFKDIGGSTSAVNAPFAVSDSVTANTNISKQIPVLANDSDPNGDPLTIDAHGSAAHGTVTCTLTDCTYQSDPDYVGDDSFGYTISDPDGNTAHATVSLKVTPIPTNHAPVAGNDFLTIDEDVPDGLNVLNNDTDEDGDLPTLNSYTQGTHGAVFCQYADCTYTPEHNWSGTDTFTYTESDGLGGVATGTVTVTVNPVNDAPVAANDTLTTDEDTPKDVAVTANDTDADQDSLTADVATQPQHGSVACAGGTCTYTPKANYNGPDSFTYYAYDGTVDSATAATVSITVTAVNDAPVAKADTLVTAEDTAGTVSVLANDTDVDDPASALSVTGHTDGAHGAVTCTATTCTYTPAANYNGTDSFTYTVSDGHPGGDTVGTVAVSVSSVNDVPVATADTLTTLEDTAKSVNVLGNDTDADGDVLSITGNTNGAHGTVSCPLTGSACTYTPAKDWNGTDSFTYTISDKHGGFATGTVTVTVTAVNDPPVATPDVLAIDEDVSGSVSPLANDTDVEGDTLSLLTVTQGAHGTVTCFLSACIYTPDKDFNGTDSFTYTVSDGHGGTTTGTVTVTVRPVNDPPVANADTLTTAEDTVKTVNVIANDTDVDGDTLTATVRTNGAHGTVTCSGTSCTYTPAKDFNGTDSFTYTVSDGHGGTATGTVTVTVTPVNDAPVAVDHKVRTLPGVALTGIDVLAGATDVDGDTLTLSAHGSAAHGQVTCSTTCTYTPNDSDWQGVDSFAFTVSDGVLSDTRTVTVKVAPANRNPVAVADTLEVKQDGSAAVAVTANDTDVDGDTLAVAGSTNGDHGTVTCAGTSCTYTPTRGYYGPDSFGYTVSDGWGGTATTSVAVTVKRGIAPPGAARIGKAKGKTVVKVKVGKKVKKTTYSAMVTWAAPLADGGSKVTGYRVVAMRYTGHKITWSRSYAVSAAKLKPGLVSYGLKLKKGTYTFQVVAVNAVGAGPGSPYSNLVKVK